MVTGRKLQRILQIIMTMKVIQWNRPAGTDSVCRDEVGNEYHASSKEHLQREEEGGSKTEMGCGSISRSTVN